MNLKFLPIQLNDMKTNSMKRVMIALKNDASSKKVAETGFSLAKTMKADVVLINVISNLVHHYTQKEFQPIAGSSNVTDTSNAHIATAEKQKIATQKFLDKTKLHLGDAAIQTIVIEGDQSTSMLNSASDNKIDLLVMGARSYNSLDATVLGSVTEEVVHNIAIPIVIVPSANK